MRGCTTKYVGHIKIRILAPILYCTYAHVESFHIVQPVYQSVCV